MDIMLIEKRLLLVAFLVEIGASLHKAEHRILARLLAHQHLLVMFRLTRTFLVDLILLVPVQLILSSTAISRFHKLLAL